MFVEAYMSGNINSFGLWIKAAVPMVNRAVSKKDTREGPKFNFMSIVRTKIRKALTAKNTKEGVIWFTIKKDLERRFVGIYSRRKTINEVDRCFKGKEPEMLG
ncbi:hypothetical protein HanLR1_Chr02g0050571 [Helianthus annuus]|nr:hypothetical protein HanLR1_Chr02g0050571 [Helianthus annuus]